MVWKLFLWSFLRKSYFICRESSDMAKFWPYKRKIWPVFGQNWLFWEFLTYNFQIPLWIFLIFGMELLWTLTLFGEPIILCLVISGLSALCQKTYAFRVVRACVRVWVRPCVTPYLENRTSDFSETSHKVVSSWE